MNRTKVWAHRGASGYLPENTLPAFLLAAKQGADGVELDVQLTRDGKVVVVHDEHIDRVSEGTGLVKDHTLKELKRISFAKGFAERNTGYALEGFTTIPTLEEVYAALKDTPLTVNVELKTGIFPYEGIEEKVLALTSRMGMEKRVIYSSFNHWSLRRCRQINPGVRTGLLYEDGWIDVPRYAVDTAVADALHPSILRLKEGDLVWDAHRRGLLVHVWTVNGKEEMAACRAAGVDAVITNYPDRALSFFGEAAQ